MPQTTRTAMHAARLTVVLLLFLSGFAGLAYQVVWVRMLTSVFGVTAFAISTVLASFMAGLALGSWSFGRWIDRHPRPVLAYAILEAAIGLYALLVPALFGVADTVFKSVYDATGGSLFMQGIVRAILAFAVLVIPTTCMGATLPVLCKFFIQELTRVGSETGRLYFINTFGAVFGCAVAGFVLVPTWGLLVTTGIAAGLNLLVALVAFALHARGWGSAPVSTQETSQAPAQWGFTHRWVLVAFAISGFVALVFEVVWSRILILVFGSTVYSFSSMLSVFLLGLSVGAVVFGRIADRVRQPTRVLGWTLATLAFVVLIEHWTINHLPYVFLKILSAGDFSFAALTWVKFVLSFVVLFPAALLFGGTFPIVSRIYTDSLDVTGERIGTVYAANTVGAILGAIVGGFVFLPWLGTRDSLILIATLLVATACVTLVAPLRHARPLRLPATAVAAAFTVAVFLLPTWNRELLSLGVYFQPHDFVGPDGSTRIARILREVKTLYYEEGLNDTIIVVQSPSERSLSINGKIIATSSWQDILHLKMLGHLPVLLHPGQPRYTLNVGLGIGGTVSGFASHDVERVDVAELEEKVVNGTRLFAAANDSVVDNPKLRVLIGDGRNLLATTRDTYDVISSDPFEPFMTGAGNLYSKQYLELGKARLAPHGIMTQWLPLHQLGDREFRGLIKTFAAVFPYYTVWFSGESVILIGASERLQVDPELLTAKMHQGNSMEWLRRLGVDSYEKLFSFLLADEESMRGYADDVPVNTDMFPFVEYGSARSVYDQTIGANLARMVPHFMSVERILQYCGDPTNVDVEQLRTRTAAIRTGIDGIIDLERGNPAAFAKVEEAAQVSGDPFFQKWAALTSEEFALAAIERNDLDSAARYFESALRYQPDRITPLANLGHLRFLSGQYDDALMLYQRAASLQPGNTEFKVRTAAVYGAMGDAQRARILTERAVAQDPHSAEAAYMMGVLEMQDGQWQNAEDQLQRAIRLDPKNPEPHVALARAYVAQSNPSSARKSVERAVRLGGPVLAQQLKGDQALRSFVP